MENNRRREAYALGILQKSTMPLLVLVIIAAVIELCTPRLGIVTTIFGRMPCVMVLGLCRLIIEPRVSGAVIAAGTVAIALGFIAIPHYTPL